MENSFLLQQVVKNLEEHENSVRIKKLIFAVCKDRWENDKNTLNNFKLQDLIQELQTTHPTLEELKLSLARFVKTLNKPQEYSLVAKAIFSNVGRLYPETQKSNQLITIGDNKPVTTIQYNNQNLSNLKQESKSNERRRAYDPFDLRLEIMKYTNPLRAKIILFSILYEPFDFSKQAWLNIRAHQIDDLLRRLFRAYKTFTELESELYSTVRSLKEPEENNKTAKAIIHCLKPLYTSGQPGVGQAFATNEEEMITRVTAIEQNQENQADGMYGDDNTCQFISS